MWVKKVRPPYYIFNFGYKNSTPIPGGEKQIYQCQRFHKDDIYCCKRVVLRDGEYYEESQEEHNHPADPIDVEVYELTKKAIDIANLTCCSFVSIMNVLMTRRRTDDYVVIMEKISLWMINNIAGFRSWAPQVISSDFEPAIYASVDAVFGGLIHRLKHRGCNFDFEQAILRRLLKSKQLKTSDYCSCSRFNEYIHNGQMIRRPRFSHSMWMHSSLYIPGIVRRTCEAEAYHARLNAWFRKTSMMYNKPLILRLIVIDCILISLLATSCQGIYDGGGKVTDPPKEWLEVLLNMIKLPIYYNSVIAAIILLPFAGSHGNMDALHVRKTFIMSSLGYLSLFCAK
uniref:Uncharacterized protein n=1 Tax=Ditylenchus dipsaci TaxID=166011 RepID=A0A915E475_9BILA